MLGVNDKDFYLISIDRNFIALINTSKEIYILFDLSGEAEFACGRGHRLVGVKKATCLNNGEWSVALTKENKNDMKSMLPECMPVTCAKPKAPENGGVSADGEYRMLG